jgi:alpha-galactosidase
MESDPKLEAFNQRDAAKRGMNRREMVRRLLGGAGLGYAAPALAASQPIHKNLMNTAMPAQGNRLALTPPMGWNAFFPSKKVGDDLVRAGADAMVSRGMKAAGYEYVIVDDTWEGGRDSFGYLYPDGHFPDMKALIDYVHSKGLKFGIYSSPGRKTCAGFEGSFGHEDQDAETFAAWGVDYLKYDWCSGTGDQVAADRRMYEALKRTGRPIVFALCQYGDERVWTWGASVGGNTWRTTSDIALNGVSYDAIALVGFEQNGLERFAGPGHWNDPDALLIGEPEIDDDEARTQMSLWCLLAAPLIASNDLTTMSPATQAILTNPEVIAVNQDSAGIQGHRVAEEGPLEVWMKPLADGSKAIGLFNREATPMPVTLRFRDAGLPEGVLLRDLWASKDLGVFQRSFTARVLRHGVVMLKATAQS